MGGLVHKNERFILSFNLLLRDPKASFASEESVIAAACEWKSIRIVNNFDSNAKLSDVYLSHSGLL